MVNDRERENAKHLPIFKLDGQRNKMEFIATQFPRNSGPLWHAGDDIWQYSKANWG